MYRVVDEEVQLKLRPQLQMFADSFEGQQVIHSSHPTPTHTIPGNKNWSTNGIFFPAPVLKSAKKSFQAAMEDITESSESDSPGVLRAVMDKIKDYVPPNVADKIYDQVMESEFIAKHINYYHPLNLFPAQFAFPVLTSCFLQFHLMSCHHYQMTQILHRT